MISNLWLPGNNTRLYIHIICTVTRSIFRYMLKCIEICIYIYIYKWARDYYINKFHWTINGKRGLALLDLFVAFVEPYHGRHSVEQNHVHEMSPLRQKSLGFDAKKISVQKIKTETLMCPSWLKEHDWEPFFYQCGLKSVIFIEF